MPTNELEALLAMPRASKRSWAWGRMTSADILFRTLRTAVRTGSVGQAMQWVVEWQMFATTEQTLRQWNVVRALVWCAEQAATRPDFYRTEIDRVCFAIAEVPEFIRDRENWAWLCIRNVLVEVPRCCCVAMPVAGWNKQQSKNGGFLATLVSEALEGGAGQVAHHPADAFRTCIDDEFCAGMEGAWAAARTLLQEQGVDIQRCDGCWRLLKGWSWKKQEGEQLPAAAEANGRSASGAAVLGWSHALRGTIPDKGLIVIAQVNKDDPTFLEEVDGIKAKTQAIVDDGQFDTIVVASQENETKVVKTLQAGRQVSIEEKDPDEREPWRRVYIPFMDGHKIKVVNLNAGNS